MSALSAAIVSREYPPDVYGGAGVHVEYLSRELRKLIELSVHCFGSDRAESNEDPSNDPPNRKTAHDSTDLMTML